MGNEPKEKDLKELQKEAINVKAIEKAQEQVSGKATYECNYCNAVYGKLAKMEDHTLNHFEEKLASLLPVVKNCPTGFKCPTCDKIYAEHDLLMRHYAFDCTTVNETQEKQEKCRKEEKSSKPKDKKKSKVKKDDENSDTEEESSSKGKDKKSEVKNETKKEPKKEKDGSDSEDENSEKRKSRKVKPEKKEPESEEEAPLKSSKRERSTSTSGRPRERSESTSGKNRPREESIKDKPVPASSRRLRSVSANEPKEKDLKELQKEAINVKAIEKAQEQVSGKATYECNYCNAVYG